MRRFAVTSRNALRHPRLRPNRRHPRRQRHRSCHRKSRHKSNHPGKRPENRRDRPQCLDPLRRASDRPLQRMAHARRDGYSHPRHLSRTRSPTHPRNQLPHRRQRHSRTLRPEDIQILLNAGITTVRDVGNEAEYASVDVRNAINRGWFTGPTILTSGKIIAPFGGQGKHIPPEVGPIWRYEYIDADGPEEIRKAVRENIFYGADLIKLVADNTGAYYYSEEEIRAATNEAHNANRAWPSTFSADRPLAMSSWAAPIRSSTAGISTTTCSA